ncbi:MAG: 2-oxoacid:acceptor oxidoreductase family protein [Chitinivibrionales bacterium]|nr:2-oxoacid:acceptor oxidoreductase family protein [Chitinivibrionales bacterium]
MRKFDIYITGVGGQGIGLLAEVLIRAADHAGFPVKGVDTHGLSQRGGIVQSHVRIGTAVHSPLVSPGCADLVIALERHEALRGMNEYCRDNGTLLYYNTSWQPLDVRLAKTTAVTAEQIQSECKRRTIQEVTAFYENIPDVRMQNIVLLGYACKLNLVPGVLQRHYQNALDDILPLSTKEKNDALFNRVVNEHRE